MLDDQAPALPGQTGCGRDSIDQTALAPVPIALHVGVPFSDSELRLRVPTGILKAAGVYPLVVVRPGSGGGVSNAFYLMVTSR